jgi:small conductance mechanosensitive channel
VENQTNIVGILTGKMEGWMTGFVAILPNLVVATLVMLGFILLSRAVNNIASRLLHRTSESPAVTRLILSILKSIIILFGAFTSLGILNLDKTVASLLTGAGVIGLAIGFAFQEIAANFFAGILIAFKKPYKEGDIVKVSEHMGKVRAITLRTTNIMTFSGDEVLVPNKDMFTKAVVNFTSTPERRVELNVGVSYAEDLERVAAVAEKALQNIPGKLEHLPVEIVYTSFGDSSINFQARFWVNYSSNSVYVHALHHAILALKKAFDQNGISIPFPIRTLDFGIKGGENLSEVIQSVARLVPADDDGESGASLSKDPDKEEN